MTGDVSLMRFRIHELEGKILARQRLAEQDPGRAWHLRYVEIYTAEMRKLQVELLLKELNSSVQNGVVAYKELFTNQHI
jgi:hypothetical protein